MISVRGVRAVCEKLKRADAGCSRAVACSMGAEPSRRVKSPARTRRAASWRSTTRTRSDEPDDVTTGRHAVQAPVRRSPARSTAPMPTRTLARRTAPRGVRRVRHTVTPSREANTRRAARTDQARAASSYPRGSCVSSRTGAVTHLFTPTRSRPVLPHGMVRVVVRDVNDLITRRRHRRRVPLAGHGRRGHGRRARRRLAARSATVASRRWPRSRRCRPTTWSGRPTHRVDHEARLNALAESTRRGDVRVGACWPSSSSGRRAPTRPDAAISRLSQQDWSHSRR